MNWTGGSLQRTKNANRGTLQKQKAYFARARTQLQNDTNRPAVIFRPNYLCAADEFDLVQQSPSLGSASIRRSSHSARRRGEKAQKEASQGKLVWAGDGANHSQVLHHTLSPKVTVQCVTKGEMHGF